MKFNFINEYEESQDDLKYYINTSRVNYNINYNILKEIVDYRLVINET